MDTQASTTTRLITGEKLFEMPGMETCELVEGKVKKMSPTGREHGRIEVKLGRYLNEFVQSILLARSWSVGMGSYIHRGPDIVRAADVLFISHERLKETSPEDFLDVAPELVVEIISPTNKWEAGRRKIEEYFGVGVDQVWIVEPENRTVQVYQGLDVVRMLFGG